MTLQTNGTQRIARLTIRAEVPGGGDCASLKLRFEDGFKSPPSMPVNNRVAFGFESFSPALGECSISICPPEPEVRLAVVPQGQQPDPDGGDTVLTGDVSPGDVLVPVDVLLSIANLPDGSHGPMGWSLSILNENCMAVESVTLSGIKVHTVYDEDTLEDPYRTIHHDDYVQDLGDHRLFMHEAHKAMGSKPSPLPEDAQGVISMLILRGPNEFMALHPNSTDTVLRIVYRIAVAEVDVTECKVSFVAGLRSKTSQPVNNIVTFRDTWGPPAPAQGLIIRLRGIGEDFGIPFVRGDANDDLRVNIADAVRIVLAVVPPQDPGESHVLPCRDTGDVDDNGRVEIPDVIYLIDYSFRGGPVPAGPFPYCGRGFGETEVTCPRGSTLCSRM